MCSKAVKEFRVGRTMVLEEEAQVVLCSRGLDRHSVCNKSPTLARQEKIRELYSMDKISSMDTISIRMRPFWVDLITKTLCMGLAYSGQYHTNLEIRLVHVYNKVKT